MSIIFFNNNFFVVKEYADYYLVGDNFGETGIIYKKDIK